MIKLHLIVDSLEAYASLRTAVRVVLVTDQDARPNIGNKREFTIKFLKLHTVMMFTKFSI